MISSYIFKKKSGVIIKDTQTGLRGIPKKYLREVQEVKGEGFEYEQNMLKNIVTNNIEYEELEIQTIYNKTELRRLAEPCHYIPYIVVLI